MTSVALEVLLGLLPISLLILKGKEKVDTGEGFSAGHDVRSHGGRVIFHSVLYSYSRVKIRLGVRKTLRICFAYSLFYGAVVDAEVCISHLYSSTLG